MAVNDKFCFRKIDSIGCAGAESDNEFLNQCFVDTGDLDILRNCEHPKCIALGRTGAGKTALLLKLEDAESRVIRISPENLALEYISNTDILGYLSRIGVVKLDTFFKMLWRHVFTIEVIRRHYRINDEQEKVNVILNLRRRFSKNDNVALDYLEKYSGKLWKETEYNVKEITQELENSIKAAIGDDTILKTFVQGGHSLSEEKKIEVVNRIQPVVDSPHIRELAAVTERLDKIINDEQKKYFIVIDQLDDEWIDKQRFELIRALIETAKDFYNKSKQVKIILALRTDLLEQVYKHTMDKGFQAEKYEDLNLSISWSNDQLIDLLEKRINCLIRQTYTKQNVTWQDVLPKEIDGTETIYYILDRTMMRPRDVISFFNKCIEQATGSPVITQEMIKEAEGIYSRDRYGALIDEWKSLYPNLKKFFDILRNQNYRFTVLELPQNLIDDFMLKHLYDQVEIEDDLSISFNNYADKKINQNQFIVEIIKIFYKIGAIGLKVDKSDQISWAFQNRSISDSEITNNTLVQIHPSLWRTLGIQKYKDESCLSRT